MKEMTTGKAFPECMNWTINMSIQNRRKSYRRYLAQTINGKILITRFENGK